MDGVKFALWGFRRHDSHYQFVTGEFAAAHGLPVLGSHDMARNVVTVAGQPVKPGQIEWRRA